MGEVGEDIYIRIRKIYICTNTQISLVLKGATCIRLLAAGGHARKS